MPQESTETPIPGETRDISRGGICFVAHAGWNVGTEIECEIQLQPTPLKPLEVRCRGRIVRVVQREQGVVEVGASVDQYWYPEPPPGLQEMLAS